MLLSELKDDKLLAVVYPGRFQPFHRGHYGVWRELLKWFGEDRVWIATSNKTNFNSQEDVSPLNFVEKQELITSLYEIPSNKIIRCANPAFSPKEVLELYKGPTVLVLVVGEKDAARYAETKNFKEWPMKHGKPVKWASYKEDAGLVNGTQRVTYYLVNDSQLLPGVTGTKVRTNLLELADDQKGFMHEFKRVFGKWDAEIARMLLAKLKMIK